MKRIPTWVFGIGLLIVTVNSGRSDEPRVVIEKHFKAMLGGERIPPAALLVKFVLKEDAEPPARGEMHIQSATTRRLSLKSIQEGVTPPQEGAILDGKKGWEFFEGTWEKLDRLDVEAATRFESLLGAPVLTTLLTRTNVTLTPLTDTTLDGRPAVGFKAAYRGPNGGTASYYFDKETGLLVKSNMKEKGGINTTVVLSGHRDLATLGDEKILRTAGVEPTPEGLLAYLKRRAPDAAKLRAVDALVRKLGDDDFDVREQAEKDLIALGAVATGSLERAARDRDAEVSRRALACLKQILRQNEGETFVAVLRQFVWRRPVGCVSALLAIIPGAKDDDLREIKAALVALAELDGKTDPALLRALEDKEPRVRAVAEAVLGKDGGDYLKQPGRRLFQRGGKMPTMIKVSEGKEVIAEFEIVDVQFFNSFDPKLFIKPR